MRSASLLMRATINASDVAGAPRLMASSVARSCTSYSLSTPSVASSGTGWPGGPATTRCNCSKWASTTASGLAVAPCAAAGAPNSLSTVLRIALVALSSTPAATASADLSLPVASLVSLATPLSSSLRGESPADSSVMAWMLPCRLVDGIRRRSPSRSSQVLMYSLRYSCCTAVSVVAMRATPPESDCVPSTQPSSSLSCLTSKGACARKPLS